MNMHNDGNEGFISKGQLHTNDTLHRGHSHDFQITDTNLGKCAYQLKFNCYVLSVEYNCQQSAVDFYISGSAEAGAESKGETGRTGRRAGRTC